MALALFSLFAWCILCVFLSIPKQLGFIGNTIVYMTIVICITLIATLMSLNLRLFQLSDQLHLFYCFWLSRTVIIPLVLLGSINLCLRPGGLFRKILAPILSLAIALFIEWMERTTGATTYTGWKFVYFACVYSFIYILNVGWFLLLRKINGRQRDANNCL